LARFVGENWSVRTIYRGHVQQLFGSLLADARRRPVPGTPPLLIYVIYID
jgi:hypothetical protein